MIYGIGTDIVDMSRMRRIYSRYGERAARRILTEVELVRFRESRESARFISLHFAAKEAVVKALGTGFRPGMGLHDIAVVPEPLGRPTIRFSARGAKLVKQRGGGQTHVTLSDDGGFAIAVAVMMGLSWATPAVF